MSEHCPDAEALARFAEGRLDEKAREAILDHAADCVVCRRQLAVSALPLMAEQQPAASAPAPVRPSLLRWWSLAAAILAATALWWWWKSAAGGRQEGPVVRTLEPAPVPAPAPKPSPTPVPAPPPEVAPEPRMPEPPPEPRPEQPPETPPPVPAPRPEEPKPEPSPAPVPTPEPTPKQPPAPVPPAPDPSPGPKRETVADAVKPVDAGKLLRVATLEPFGTLKLEPEGARAADVQGACIVSSQMRLLAGTKPSGLRLQDGTRVQLAAGSSASVFRSETQHCPGVRVHEGAVLVELPKTAKYLFIARGARTALLEGASGTLLISAGARADSLQVTPLTAAITCRADESKRVETPAGETLTLETDAVDGPRRDAKALALRSRFVAWPEGGASLLYLSFEPDFAAVEKFTLKQGRVDPSGWVSASVGEKAKTATMKTATIEIELPEALPERFKEVGLRIRFRTLGLTINIAAPPPDDSLSTSLQVESYTVPSSQRSAKEWTTATLVLSASTWWYSTTAKDRGRKLTFAVDVPPKTDPSKMVFDIDEIEIIRRP